MIVALVEGRSPTRQQHGALPHFHMAVRGLLEENLLEAWIGRARPMSLPLIFLDHTAGGLHIFGYKKDQIYQLVTVQ
jgi:hypothetical protein